MKRDLYKRLTLLEKKSAAAVAAARRESVEGSGAAKVREILGAHNFDQLPAESLAGAFARFFGVSCPQLRTLLLERSYGS